MTFQDTEIKIAQPEEAPNYHEETLAVLSSIPLIWHKLINAFAKHWEGPAEHKGHNKASFAGFFSSPIVAGYAPNSDGYKFCQSVINQRRSLLMFAYFVKTAIGGEKLLFDVGFLAACRGVFPGKTNEQIIEALNFLANQFIISKLPPSGIEKARQEAVFSVFFQTVSKVEELVNDYTFLDKPAPECKFEILSYNPANFSQYQPHTFILTYTYPHMWTLNYVDETNQVQTIPIVTINGLSDLLKTFESADVSEYKKSITAQKRDTDYTLTENEKIIAEKVQSAYLIIASYHSMVQSPECCQALRSACSAYQKANLERKYNPTEVADEAHRLYQALNECLKWLTKEPDAPAARKYVLDTVLFVKSFVQQFQSLQYRLYEKELKGTPGLAAGGNEMPRHRRCA